MQSAQPMDNQHPKRQINWSLINSPQHHLRIKTPIEEQELDRQLWYACDRIDEKLVKELLEKGANPKNLLQWHVPPLHLLVPYCYSPCARDICALMLEHGADPNVRNGDGGETPLMVLAQKKWCKEVEKTCLLFLAHGADPNLQDDRMGNTALMLVHSPVICKLLLDAGANMFTSNLAGNTALHCQSLQCNTLNTNLIKDHPNRKKLIITLLACMKYHPIASIRDVYELQRRYKIIVPFLMQYTVRGFVYLKNNQGKSMFNILHENLMNRLQRNQ